jgi:nitrite reductase (NO-forming)
MAPRHRADQTCLSDALGFIIELEYGSPWGKKGPSMTTPEITRRTFLDKALLASGAIASGVIAGSAYVGITGSERPNGATIDRDHSAAPPETDDEIVPARQVTTAEISRHPSALPRTTDYTLFDEGRYQSVVPRSGPLTQVVHFHIAEHVAEVLPGTTMEYWTFDGGIPGPMIRARAGDTIDFFLHNPKESTLPHNVDFHAVTGPGGGAARLTTAAGEVSELKARLLNPGIFVYHCAFPDIPMHISHGMYGLIVVEPPEGLPAVDHEFYLMQSEFYTDKGGGLPVAQLEDAGHLAFSGEYGRLEQPTFVVFNGRPNAATAERALGVFGGTQINVGETVRIFGGNIGPNLAASFHVIGEIFDRVYVEGSFDLVNRNVQTTLIPSGGATGVEYRADYPGDYTVVDHSIFRIHKGAIASIHVEGEPDPAIFESITYSNHIAGGH